MTEDQAEQVLRRDHDVSRETFARLKTHVALLRKWNPVVNLVSPGSLADVWRRHVLDSAQIWALRPEGAHIWVDLGSGGGFPGLVIAALAAQDQPKMQVHLIESDNRKAAFLATVLRETGLGGRVHAARIEEVNDLRADVVSARALAPLNRLLAHAESLLAPGGTALFPKGASWKTELTQAEKSWTFTVDAVPSKTSPDAAILKIGNIKRA